MMVPYPEGPAFTDKQLRNLYRLQEVLAWDGIEVSAATIVRVINRYDVEEALNSYDRLEDVKCVIGWFARFHDTTPVFRPAITGGAA